MKKIITLLISLGSAFFLSGCVDEDMVVKPKTIEELQAVAGSVNDSERKNTPQHQTWDKFTFMSLTGEEDLTVMRKKAEEEGAIAISTSPYNERYLAVVVYTTDCEVCKQHAPMLDQMLGELPHRNLEGEGTDFIIIFSDVSAETENPDIDWVQNLANVKAYGNVVTACSGGACRQVFWPEKISPSAGAVLFFVDKENVMNTHRGTIWTEATLNYDAMQTEIARFMKLSAINFDAGVVGETDVAVGIEHW